MGKEKGLLNLKPMKPGETRNPNGRPVGAKGKKNKTIQQVCQDVLELDPATGKKMTYPQYVKFLKEWCLKSPTVARHILEHANGKAPDTINLETEVHVIESRYVEGDKGSTD